jgi:hypothetical protein
MDLRSALHLADGVCIAGRLLIEALAWRLDYLNRNAASAALFTTRRASLKRATIKLSFALARARASSELAQLLEPLEEIVRESQVSSTLCGLAQLGACVVAPGPLGSAVLLTVSRARRRS